MQDNVEKKNFCQRDIIKEKIENKQLYTTSGSSNGPFINRYISGQKPPPEKKK